MRRRAARRRRSGHASVRSRSSRRSSAPDSSSFGTKPLAPTRRAAVAFARVGVRGDQDDPQRPRQGDAAARPGRTRHRRAGRCRPAPCRAAARRRAPTPRRTLPATPTTACPQPDQTLGGEVAEGRVVVDDEHRTRHRPRIARTRHPRGRANRTVFSGQWAYSVASPSWNLDGSAHRPEEEHHGDHHRRAAEFAADRAVRRGQRQRAGRWCCCTGGRWTAGPGSRSCTRCSPPATA